MDLRNVGILPQHYGVTTQQDRRLERIMGRSYLSEDLDLPHHFIDFDETWTGTPVRTLKYVQNI
jgi:hypothetical protein